MKNLFLLLLIPAFVSCNKELESNLRNTQAQTAYTNSTESLPSGSVSGLGGITLQADVLLNSTCRGIHLFLSLIKHQKGYIIVTETDNTYTTTIREIARYDNVQGPGGLGMVQWKTPVTYEAGIYYFKAVFYWGKNSLQGTCEAVVHPCVVIQ